MACTEHVPAVEGPMDTVPSVRLVPANAVVVVMKMPVIADREPKVTSDTEAVVDDTLREELL